MKYRDYRRYHGPLTSFTLSVHPALWYGVPVVIGLIWGLS